MLRLDCGYRRTRKPPLDEAFVNHVTDEPLKQAVQFKNTHGMPNERILWQMLAHLVNHGTQYKTEAAAIFPGISI
jgi:uncharacterized damage-inducible protein DinB